MTLYLDTNVVLFLAQPALERIPDAVLGMIEESELRISPMVMLELAYLFEVGRLKLSARDIRRKIERELAVRVCPHPFADVMEASLDETWTRDPFDRVIVAHAKAAGLHALVTADERIRAHYVRAVWG